MIRRNVWSVLWLHSPSLVVIVILPSFSCWLTRSFNFLCTWNLSFTDLLSMLLGYTPKACTFTAVSMTLIWLNCCPSKSTFKACLLPMLQGNLRLSFNRFRGTKQWAGGRRKVLQFWFLRKIFTIKNSISSQSAEEQTKRKIKKIRNHSRMLSRKQFPANANSVEAFSFLKI